MSDIRLGLAGDTMLGRKVAERIERDPHGRLFSDEVVAAAREADAFILNLECCISSRGEPWPDPRKPFFFRTPPEAIPALEELGVTCVTLANNHALDFGEVALLDTLDLLAGAGIQVVGAGPDLESARGPVSIDVNGFSLRVVAFSDHPPEFEAGARSPGVAYADIDDRLPDWLVRAVSEGDADAVLVTPHWGPNMTAAPLPYVRRAAAELRATGATLVAGHSAHVFHGITEGVIFDLGDFLDDYAVDPMLRNDLGLLFLVDVDQEGVRRIEAVPLGLDYCYTRLASQEEWAWIAGRFERACSELGTVVNREGDRLVAEWPVGG